MNKNCTTLPDMTSFIEFFLYEFKLLFYKEYLDLKYKTFIFLYSNIL